MGFETAEKKAVFGNVYRVKVTGTALCDLVIQILKYLII